MGPERRFRDKLVRDTGLLLRRSFREGLRSPIFSFQFPVVFPILLIALTSQSFRQLVLLPGFPIRPFAAYEAPAIFLLAAMMGAGYSATALVVDLQTGFLDRLRLLPVKPAAILLGRLAFDFLRVLPAGAIFLVVMLAFGARLDSGLPGAAALLALLGFWSVAYNGFFFVLALKTRNAQAPLALIPIFMPLTFLSPAFLPESFLPGWIRGISAVNPYSHLIEAARSFMTGIPTWGIVGKALASTTVVLVATQLLAVRSFSGLMGAPGGRGSTGTAAVLRRPGRFLLGAVIVAVLAVGIYLALRP
ncbi:MAG: ABC transporter permease [Candidatus Methylomirabilales bacterium]